MRILILTCSVLLGLGLGCSPAAEAPTTAAPLGMILAQDGVTYAGAAVVDITPTILETFTDLDQDGTFDGCLDDPTASRDECEEPFDDVNHNGRFDALFIGGFMPLRPAQSIHDPITVRALVLSHDGEYVALCALDLIGLMKPRIDQARQRLAAAGFDPIRLVVISTHNHEGPDTLGLWGDPENLADPTSGLDLDYQDRVTAAIEQAVRQAATAMEPVSLRVGSVALRERSDHFNGEWFGGTNPTPRMHGLINDIRDPVIVSDQLLVAQGVRADDSAVFTLTNWAGHPETWGDQNSAISADYVGVTRTILEAQYGGIAIHVPECLGGMQSADGGDVPLVAESGEHRFQICDAAAVADPEDAPCYGQAVGAPRLDSHGDPVPEWAEHESWDFVRSLGWHIAEAASDALATAERYSNGTIRIDQEVLYVPVENIAYLILGPLGILDRNLDEAIYDVARCPEASAVVGCLETTTKRITVGPIGWITAPGELLPELAWGLPTDDPRWAVEADDPTARGADSAYFPQHDSACDNVSWSDCLDVEQLGDCHCLQAHAWPYTLGNDAKPLFELLDTEYRAVISAADDYLAYIIPEPDFNTAVSLLSEDDGDHYEETVTPGHSDATRLQQAQQAIDARWSP